MKRFMIVLLLCVSGGVWALNVEDVTVSGHYLGVFNHIEYGDNSVGAQFDMATNIDVIYALNDRMTGVIEFQGGSGNGRLGFQNEGLVVTDLNLTYRVPGKHSSFTFGSFDLPFGVQTERLTNNANAFGSPFLLNTLMYSALGGSAGTANTVGLKGDYDMGKTKLVWSMSNGVGNESSLNDNSRFSYLISVSQNDFFVKKYNIAVSYVVSEDRFDDNDSVYTSGFFSDFQGIIFEDSYAFTDRIQTRGSLGLLRFGDGDSATKDDVFVSSSELNIQLNNGWSAALRGSYWKPEDNDNNGTGMSSVISQPGLSTASTNDDDILRFQFSLSKPIEENFIGTAEIVYDVYKEGSDVGALLLYVNGAF